MTNDLATIERPRIDLVPIAELKTAVAGFGPITSAETAQRVADLLSACVAMRDRIGATFNDHIARAFAAHRALIEEKRNAEQPILDAERHARALLAGWAALEQARVEHDRRAAAAAHAATVAELMTQADRAEALGEISDADELRLAVAATPPPTITPVAPVAGITTRDTWSARVDDLAQLVKAAAANPTWIALLKPDMTALNAQARSLRGRLRIPGVSAVRTTGIAARRGARSDE